MGGCGVLGLLIGVPIAVFGGFHKNPANSGNPTITIWTPGELAGVMAGMCLYFIICAVIMYFFIVVSREP